MEDLEKSFVQRRGWPRTIMEKLIEEARLLLKSHPQEEAPPTEVINVSASGAGVLTPVSLEKGTQVRLQILGKDLPKLIIRDVRNTLGARIMGNEGLVQPVIILRFFIPVQILHL